MKIQENSVWDKYPGDTNVHSAVFRNAQTIATHVLELLVKSVVSPLSHIFGKFATNGIKTSRIMPIF